jgi:hypothetical protein
MRAATPIRSDLIGRLHQKINLSSWMYHALTITGRPIFIGGQVPSAPQRETADGLFRGSAVAELGEADD